MKRSPSSTVLAASLVALVLIAQACSVVDAPSGPDMSAPAASSPYASMLVTCYADAAAGTMRCDGPPAQATPGLSLAVLGGQGTYVALSNGGPSYDGGTGIFEADVLIQNLIAQPLGTSDGSTATGVKIFHHSGPTSTAGGGSVTVSNADGTGTFTGANQPYFQYCTGPGATTCGLNDILTTNETSDPRTWRWQLSGGATAFTFTVLIQAQIPHESSVLKWAAQTSNVAVQLNDIWGSSATTLFAVGDGGTIVRTTNGGTNWSTQNSTVTEKLGGVWGVSSSEVVAVRLSPGSGSNQALRTANGGTNWATVDAGTTQSLNNVWGVSTTVFAVGGTGGGGRIRVSTNSGSQYLIGASNTNLGTQLNGVWAVSGTEAWAVGNGGVIVHSTTAATNGTVWAAQTSPLGSGVNLNAVWGLSATDLWIVGDGGAILHTTDGGTNWSDQSGVTGNDLYGVWGPSASDIFAVGANGEIVHYDGTSWRAFVSPTSEVLRGVFGSSGTDVFVVGGTGTILRGTR